MQFSQEIDTRAYVIRGYAPGEIQISEPLTTASILDAANDPEKPMLKRRTLRASCIITPGKLIEDWSVTTVDELAARHIEHIISLNPEIVLIGTGERLVWPKRALLAPLQERQIGLEIMDTAAACRTYNVLMFEGRRVAAALMMI